jgi:ATP-dependent DNA helicase RecG
MPLRPDPDSPVQFLKKVGPKRAAALKEAGVRTIRDLLYHLPSGYLDLSAVETIGNLRSLMDSGQWITVIGNVIAFDLIGRPPRQRLAVTLGDNSGTVQLVFFHSIHFFKKAFAVGETLAISGKVTGYGRKPQIVHPSIDRIDPTGDGSSGGFLHTGGIVPKYSSSGELKDAKLHVKALREVMKLAVDEYADAVGEILPSAVREREGLIPINTALRSIHFPESKEALESARKRLKFDELFLLQLMLGLRRNRVKIGIPGIAFDIKSKLARRLVDSLPFQLTHAQIRVIKEIAEDLGSPKPMNRLLQGDVGSGKTIVALIAMLIAIENGYQAAFMAPTEVLAEQHFLTLGSFLKDLPVNVRLLVGGQRSRLRRDVLEDVRRGSAQLVVGTHALIQESVEYARLGLIIIDEQQRFGVTQRVALVEKGKEEGISAPHPDVLVMTATPIPRTLSLTVYGDLDVSVIDEMPAHRRPVKTLLRFESERKGIYRFLAEQLGSGRQAYVIYPLIEESEKVDLKAATESYEMLKEKVFPGRRVGLIHGRLPAEEKEAVMGAFKRGELDLLVSTTVIEVGIDIPNATVMLIEHAERFGLSQLHQLRGRVGRGSDQSYCILAAPDWMRRLRASARDGASLYGEEDDKQKAVRRLKTMLDTTDGFKIAEIDLEIRGPGDFFGTRQSGLPGLQIANLVTDAGLLTVARKEAFDLLASDPHLRLAEHLALRNHFRERMRDALALVDVG